MRHKVRIVVRAGWRTVFALLASGCASAPVASHVSADQIMNAQYVAREAYGAMSGKEASLIIRKYIEQIGAPVVEAGSGATDISGSSGASGYERH
ncbi:MAG TPA: hypothetical protein VFS01_09975 [Rhizomicrobium sp.]|jgi:hypothetical protein|nr:hypothetical protein [Rhizomicrobium sp.]